MHVHIPSTTLAGLAALALAACGGGTGSGAARPVTLTGVVTKGPLRNADVVVYALGARGDRGAELARGRTSADGSGAFAVTLPAAPAGPVLVEASGGSYVSESDVASLPQTTPCRTVLPSVGDGAAPVAVNPVTDLAASRTLALLGGGAAPSQAVSGALADLRAHFAFDADVLHLVPSFDTADASAANAQRLQLGLLLIALDQFAHEASLDVDPDRVYAAFARDFEDGVLDCDGSVDAYGDAFAAGGDRGQRLMDALLRSMHYALGGVANGLLPSTVAAYARAHPESADVQPDLSDRYTCTPGTALVFDDQGYARCWDGTRDADGLPYLGDYWECYLVGGVVEAYASDPGTCSDGGIPMMQTSLSLAAYHAATPELFRAQEVKLLTPEELAAMRAADLSAPLPAWATAGARLDDDQLAAINTMYGNLQEGWKR